MKAVAVIANMTKLDVAEVAGRICSWCKARQVEVWAQRELQCGCRKFSLEQSLPPVDLVLILGGDGTFLNVARHYVGTDIPFLGVNLGQLGFLTEVEVADLESALEKLVAREFTIEKRAMLSVQVLRDDKVVEDTFALNEVTIAKGTLARIIHLDVSVDQVPIGSYYGDGLIVSTPTGSTGYSLSAGGPIVAPNVQLTIITPICPHTLNARPIVVARDALIDIDLTTCQQDMVLSVDGQHSFFLECGDRIHVSNSPYETKLVRLRGKDFFDILREKLMYQNR